MSTSDPAERLASIAGELRALAASGMPVPHPALRQAVNAAVLLYSVEVARTRREVPLADPAVTATDLVVLACALLRAGNLNPFDLALWFGRVATDETAA